MIARNPMAGQLLPLFPLQVVLFPGSALPLHIFEERYKQLIGECLREGAEFGINLADGKTVSPIGCTAIVRSVRRRYDDGRMDIVVEGRRRYRLEEFFDDRAPYPVGSVRFIAEPEEAVDLALAEQTVGLYEALVAVVYKEGLRDRLPSPDAREVSFVIAQKAGLDLQQRQGILEIESENDRLRALKAHLTDVIPKLRQFEEVERVIRSDGYL